ncbi:hypothetical protein ACWCQL_10105 [Streptomyces sp. NPDC002073]
MSGRPVRAGGGGGGGLGCLSFVGFLFAGYLLGLPAVLPLLIKPPDDGPRPTLILNPVLWLVSLLTAVLLAWMAGGRGPLKPKRLAVHTALLGGGAALAVFGGAFLGGLLEEKIRTGLAGESAEDIDFFVSFVTALVEIVAAGIVTLVVFQAVRSRYAPAAPPGPWIGPRTGPRRAPAVAIMPRPAEVWVAEVPLREDPGRTLRHYCVIVHAHATHASVLQITSQDKDYRQDHIRMPNDGWDFKSGKAHWLEIGRPPREVPYGNFLSHRPQGMCPESTWREIARAHLER